MSYGIREGYSAREVPEYFIDNNADGKTWQPDVYPLAAELAVAAGANIILDLGCGRAEKLMALAQDFKVIGVDTGTNITYCRQRYPEQTWFDIDLEHTSDIDQIAPMISDKTVIVCADVIEHLIDPGELVAALARWSKIAAAVIVSTPDRLAVYGRDQDGPPANRFHVREWTLDELRAYFEAQGMAVHVSGHTKSNDQDDYYHTAILIGGTADLYHKVRPVIRTRETRRADVSVLLPVYNGQFTIKRAIRSALAQPGVDVEVVVVDDGSTDDTPRLIDELMVSTRQRFTAIHQKNAGLVEALRTALKAATGRYLIRLDADDWYKRGALIKLMEALDAGAGFAYGSVVYHGRSSMIFRPDPYRREDFYRHNASLYPVMFRREALKTCQIRTVCETVVGLEDWDFVLQLIDAGYEGRALPEVTVMNYLYTHGSMMQQSKNGQEALFEAFRRLWPKVEATRL